MDGNKYILRNTRTDEYVIISLEEILEEINRDRSEEWQDYDETDWQEGLNELTEEIK